MRAFMIVRDDGLYIEQNFTPGQTHHEPGNKRPPRLWFSPAKARSWLTTYCKGAHVPNLVWTDDGYESFTGPYQTQRGLRAEPDTARNRERFRIVGLDIKQVSV